MGCDTERLQKEIDSIIIKTILSVHAKLLYSYRGVRDYK